MKKLLLISQYTAGAFIGLVVLLHIIKPDVNPVWQPISEYALGSFGWIMNGAFFLLGVSFLSLGIYFFGKIKSVGAKIGSGLLILSAIGNFLATFFNTDPVGTLPEKLSSTGQIHAMAAGFLVFMVLSTVFILWQFIKRQDLKDFKNLIIISTIFVWIFEIVLDVAMGIYLSKTNGVFSPDTPVGWYGRAYIISTAVWIIVCSLQMIKVEKKQQVLG